MEYSINKRPTFRTWLRLTWFDILNLLVVGGVGFALSYRPPLLTRTFPLTVASTGEVVYPDFAYPYRRQFIPSWLDAVLGVGIPALIIILANTFKVRSFWDTNNGLMGLAAAHVYSTTAHCFLKWVVGGLRPHFYDLCRPDLSRARLLGHGQQGQQVLGGSGFQHYMFTAEQICTPFSSSSSSSSSSAAAKAAPWASSDWSHLKNALQSFPSGHTTTMFAGMVYASLYLNAKLKVFSNHHPACWKLGALSVPLLFAACVAGSLTVDRSHNWYDVLAGAALGTAYAVAGFRMAYASVWDWRMNHVPLHRGVVPGKGGVGGGRGARGGEEGISGGGGATADEGGEAGITAGEEALGGDVGCDGQGMVLTRRWRKGEE